MFAGDNEGTVYSLVNAANTDFTGFNLDNSSPLYSHNKAAACALISKLVYEKSEIVQRLSSSWGFSVVCVKYRDTNAYVFGRNDVIVVAFRGTSPLCLGNVITDLKTSLRSVDSLGKVICFPIAIIITIILPDYYFMLFRFIIIYYYYDYYYTS